ncbi:hypothetical protein PU02_0213 [Bartonella ancashensis]|uniref:Uncharacterized protein n=1 Tax=Bartonella ancashensis TaxID=1318743 RepID=A0A0M4LIS3_9HYPH|nr:hypothetical protein PU02_0213 [Bartonella ancashensis]
MPANLTKDERDFQISSEDFLKKEESFLLILIVYRYRIMTDKS